MTKIITTVGPSSYKAEVLGYFKKHGVAIARLNFSHNTPEWHLAAGKTVRESGLEILVDLSGPKIRLADLSSDIQAQEGQLVFLEKADSAKSYPYWDQKDGHDLVVLPTSIDLTKFLEPKKQMLIDDGKIQLNVEKIEGERILAKVNFAGKIKSHKGINLPETDIKIPFLTERDKSFLRATLLELKPEFVASSFVKTAQEVRENKEFIRSLLDEAGVMGYFPKICTKLEMAEALEDKNLEEIIDESDLIMIARGDMALETTPIHLKVPFLQEKVKQFCRRKNKPFVVATQVLESMISSPVPTRAEVSDLYRAVVIDQADYVMLSGESAAGDYPKKCVDLIEGMIKMSV